jgi:hypothetical protein
MNPSVNIIKLIHVSYFVINALHDYSNLCCPTILNTFKCSITEIISLILIIYSFFLRNNLFIRDFDWYKLPNLSHGFLTDSSPETFNNTEYARKRRIIILVLLSSFSHSSLDMTVGIVPGQTVAHYSRCTRISSILSFQSSKF